MDEIKVSAKEHHLLQSKSFCRLCLSSIDAQTLLFSNPSVDALFERVHQCTGVRLMDFPDMYPRACDGCVSQLVICEKFVKQCREVEQKLRHLFQHSDGTRIETGPNESLIPVQQLNNDEPIPKAKVQRLEPKLDDTACVTPYEGKSTGDEFYVVEIVDTNHEYEIDHSSENVPEVKIDPASTVSPDKSGIIATDTHVAMKCRTGRETIKKTHCSVCGTMQQNLKQHMLVHTGEKKHTCPVCKKAFAQKGNLTYHMYQHSNNCPYGCDQCDKAFKDPQSLRSHKLTHTNERKFQCEVCEETFKYKCSLVVHSRTHTQDNRYACTECSKAFINSSGLKKHMRTHTGERPYKCSDCCKCFKASHNLTLHRLSHTKERRFQCDLCASWFSYKHVLKTHMNVHLKTGNKVHRKQATKQEIEKNNRRIIK